MRSSGIMPDIESRHRQGRVRGLRAASRLVAVALLVAPVMAGCGNGGFRPLYGSAALGGAAASERLAEVAIGPIPGRVGQQVRNELIFHATGGGGEVQEPKLRLDVAIRESVTSTLVQVDGDSRGQVFNLEARFKLINVADNSVVLSGTSYGRAGFERFQSIFSNVRARENAEDRAAKVVGEDLKARLSAYLAGSA